MSDGTYNCRHVTVTIKMGADVSVDQFLEQLLKTIHDDKDEADHKEWLTLCEKVWDVQFVGERFEYDWDLVTDPVRND